MDASWGVCSFIGLPKKRMACSVMPQGSVHVKHSLQVRPQMLHESNLVDLPVASTLYEGCPECPSVTASNFSPDKCIQDCQLAALNLDSGVNFILSYSEKSSTVAGRIPFACSGKQARY